MAAIQGRKEYSTSYKPGQVDYTYTDEGFYQRDSRMDDWEVQGYLVDMPSPRMFVVDHKTNSTGRTALLLHGFPSQGYSFREVVDGLLQPRRHGFARVIVPDWPGWGNSEKPQPGQGYDYTCDQLIKSLEQCCEQLLETGDRVIMVTQGYASPMALAFAARHPEVIASVVAINPPLLPTPSPWTLKLPKTLDGFTNVFTGPIFAQDPTRWADTAFAASGPYKLSEEDSAVYRAPYLRDGMAGFASAAVIQTIKSPDAAQLLREWMQYRAQGTVGEEKIPALLLLGKSDKYLPQDGDKQLGYESGFEEVRVLDGVGHFAQEDWPEKVVDAIVLFARWNSGLTSTEPLWIRPRKGSTPDPQPSVSYPEAPKPKITLNSNPDLAPKPAPVPTFLSAWD